MTTSADHLLTSDHRELDHLLAGVFAAIDGRDPAEAYRKLDFFWARLAVHIRAEHLRLFPAVVKREQARRGKDESASNIDDAIDRLHQDHDFFMRELARAIKAMRLVFSFGNADETFATVRQLVDSVKARLEEHNRIEEELIYPIAGSDVLGTQAADELSDLVEKEIGNLPPRFRSQMQ